MDMAGMYRLEDLVKLALREGAKELHFQAGSAPLMVSGGKSRALDLPTLTNEHVTELFCSFATEAQVEELRRCGDVGFNHQFQNSSRFRVNALMERENISVKMKLLAG